MDEITFAMSRHSISDVPVHGVWIREGNQFVPAIELSDGFHVPINQQVHFDWSVNPHRLYTVVGYYNNPYHIYDIDFLYINIPGDLFDYHHEIIPSRDVEIKTDRKLNITFYSKGIYNVEVWEQNVEIIEVKNFNRLRFPLDEYRNDKYVFSPLYNIKLIVE